jgi:hypothetical protein
MNCRRAVTTISPPALASEVDQPLAPIENRSAGAAPSSHLGWVGLDLMLAGFAPDDEPHASRSGSAPRDLAGSSGRKGIRRWSNCTWGPPP